MKNKYWFLLGLLFYLFPLCGQPGIIVDSPGKPINLGSVPSKAEQETNDFLPQIEWLSPNKEELMTGEETIFIKIRITGGKKWQQEIYRLVVNPLTNGHKANEVRLFRNQLSFDYEGQVALTAGNNEIFLEAHLPDGVKKLGRRIVYKTQNFLVDRPSLHILSIGPTLNLSYTEKDANDFIKLFHKQGGAFGNKLFKSIHTYKLTGKEATTVNIKKSLERLENQMKRNIISKKDLIIIYISSHGMMIGDDFRVLGNDFSTEFAKTYSVSYERDILYLLKNISCKKMIFMDACHGGGAKLDPVKIHEKLIIMQKVNGLTAFASSKEEEYSYEDDVWKNGAFTEGLIRGLGYGKADTNNDKVITIMELYNYLLKSVPAMVLTQKNKVQTPFLITNQLGDMPFYLLN